MNFSEPENWYYILLHKIPISKYMGADDECLRIFAMDKRQKKKSSAQGAMLTPVQMPKYTYKECAYNHADKGTLAENRCSE